MDFRYQIGGSLASTAPSYIPRVADESLWAAIQNDEFCYVFNSRQMGKSSLMGRSLQQCQANGYICTALDLTRVGGESSTPTQWYKGIVLELWRGLGLRRELKLKSWWQDAPEISYVQNLSYFIEQEILGRIPNEKIIVFVDEIDSVISLPFSVDDLFALIRFCYNQRSLNPDYRRLGFVLFGVAKPADLISDRSRTPFNIGRAIELEGLPLEQSLPLAAGFREYLPEPQQVLKEIFDWTGGQPFLTQKLCQIVSRALETTAAVESCLANPKRWVADVVQQHIVERWDSQDDPEHLKTIRDRLFYDQDQTGRLLGLYQRILRREALSPQDFEDTTELLLAGLVSRQGEQFSVKNPIYAQVFNETWIQDALQQLRPYASAIAPRPTALLPSPRNRPLLNSAANKIPALTKIFFQSLAAS